MKKFAPSAAANWCIHEAGVADLENYARSSDLVILAGGKGDIVELFERDAERSPFDKPQRALALKPYVTGLTPYAPTRVAFNIAPTVGEYFVFPSPFTTTGPCEIMVLEGIPGGPHGLLGRRENAGTAPRTQPRYPEEILPLGIRALAKCQADRSQRHSQRPLSPDGAQAVARLPSGAASSSAWPTSSCSTIRSPGRDQTTPPKAARIYLKRILTNGNKPFDGAWMQQTFDDYWAYAQFVTGWTNAMPQPPPPHVINILVAAQSKPKVGKAFVNGFDDPRTFFPWLADPGEAEKFIAAA